MGDWICNIELSLTIADFLKQYNKKKVMLIGRDNMFTAVDRDRIEENELQDIKIIAFGHQQDWCTLWVDIPTVKHLK